MVLLLIHTMAQWDVAFEVSISTLPMPKAQIKISRACRLHTPMEKFTTRSET